MFRNPRHFVEGMKAIHYHFFDFDAYYNRKVPYPPFSTLLGVFGGP